ncbi:hypothetical protein E4U54_007462 [Claviceps lovelessii]|nr:hypothetical protein E4U54_007462 [Claviceps lovelessii]
MGPSTPAGAAYEWHFTVTLFHHGRRIQTQSTNFFLKPRFVTSNIHYTVLPVFPFPFFFLVVGLQDQVVSFSRTTALASKTAYATYFMSFSSPSSCHESAFHFPEYHGMLQSPAHNVTKRPPAIVEYDLR